MADKARKQTALAAELDVEQPLVSQWLKGTARPGSKLREALEYVCGIPRGDWLDADERASVQRIRNAVATTDPRLHTG